MIYRILMGVGLAGLALSLTMALPAVIEHPLSIPLAATLAAVSRPWW